MPEESIPEPTDDLLDEWEAALDNRLQVNVGASSNSSSVSGVGRQRSRTSSATQQSKPGKASDASVDEPLKSYVDPSSNRVMCQMASGKTIALGSSL